MNKIPTSRLPVTPKPATTTKSGLRPPQPAPTAAVSSQQASPTGGDSSSVPLVIGDRVTANGKTGTVAFVGPTKFADGEWIGVILDDAQGKNDGSYEGTRYFETEPNRGLFCRITKIQRVTQNGAYNSSDTPASVTAQATSLPDTPKLSSQNLSVDKGEDADTTLVNSTEPLTPTQPPAASTSDELQIGNRVVVSGSKYGTLKYLGKIHVAEGIWCGIQLDEPLGKNDGSVSGKRYFTCQQRYGLFSPLARVEKVTNEMTQSQIVKARKASVSSSTNNAQLQRSTSQESLHSNLSEFSTSSNSVSRIPMRTPAKTQQQKIATNTNVYTTPNTKSLLTQAAATLAAVTPSSNQISNLVQTIKEKDIFIERLQSQREQDRLEFSRAAQQVDEMENRLLQFKQQYDLKVMETEELKKEQYQAKQRIEDLEFQLEEYKLTEANKDNATTPSATITIPEGHRLFSPHEIDVYEKLKAKLVEVESTNQRLLLEKQTILDEHRQELKRLQESNENDYRTRLNQLEEKHRDELKTLENNQMTSIVSDYEAKLNDKDKRFNELLEQAKQEKQQEIDQLKLQINNFQSQEQLKDKSLSEKEIFYEQQLKEQQVKLEQSENELKEIRSQLTTIQQEKAINDKQTEDLLNELKQYKENIIPSLENENQTLKLEIQNRDEAISSTLTEKESQYKELIEKYQSNLDQAVHDTEQVHRELKQLHEENISKEQQTKELIDSLKHDYEKQSQQLQSQLTELQDQEQKLNTILKERQLQHEQQLKDYESKLEQSNLDLSNIQSQLTKVQEEKQTNESKSADIINALKQDNENLKNELTDLQDRGRTQNMALTEREAHYESQIKDYQAKRDQALHEIQDLRNELARLQAEKHTNENEQIQSFQVQITELENQNQIKTNELIEKDQRLVEYQLKFDELNKENIELHQQIEHNRQEHEIKINDLRKELDEVVQRTETLAKDYENLKLTHETLKQNFEDVQTKYNDIQNECQQHLTSNEQLKTVNDTTINEKQALIDQLTKQVDELKQVHAELVEKQINQHMEFERRYSEDRKAHEKVLTETIGEYDLKIQRMQSEHIIERQNSNLENEQEKIHLKKQLQLALQGTESKQSSSTTGSNMKQLEYELAEARYLIDKLQKEIEATATKDDRVALEGQINFLNDVIVDLRNANVILKKEVDFLKNPFAAADEPLSADVSTRRKSSIPRLYCDMCEVFDQHDTDDCPKQNSLTDDQPTFHRPTGEHLQPPPPRPYCEKCEEFDHDCNETDETY